VAKTASRTKKEPAAKPEKARPKKGGEANLEKRTGPAYWLFKMEL
jgi:hypothetical protein